MLLFDYFFDMLSKSLQYHMKHTYQDALYHPEGSVYSHCRLVAEKLPNIATFQMCALAHDIGKIFVTQSVEYEDKIRIHNIGHDEKSVECIPMLKRFYDDKGLDIDWGCVEQVTRYHMRMHDYNSGKIKKLHKRQFMESLQYFEELKAFSKADADGIGTPEQALPYIIITIGISGSGKSTWAKAFAEKAGYSIINPDSIRKELTGNVSDQSRNADVWKRAYEQLDSAIVHKQNTIFDSTACNVRTINEIDKHCYNKAIVFYKTFHSDVSISENRIKLDLQNQVDRSNTPVEILNKQFKGYVEALNHIQASKYILRNQKWVNT
jgi:predicted kinase